MARVVLMARSGSTVVCRFLWTSNEGGWLGLGTASNTMENLKGFPVLSFDTRLDMAHNGNFGSSIVHLLRPDGMLGWHRVGTSKNGFVNTHRFNHHNHSVTLFRTLDTHEGNYLKVHLSA